MTSLQLRGTSSPFLLRLQPVHPFKEPTASSNFFSAELGGLEGEAVQCLASNSEIKWWRYYYILPYVLAA